MLPGEDARGEEISRRLGGKRRGGRGALDPSFHASPLLDPSFDIPKSHYGLTLKQMESLGLHEAVLNGTPDPVSFGLKKEKKKKENKDGERKSGGDDAIFWFSVSSSSFFPFRLSRAVFFLPRPMLSQFTSAEERNDEKPRVLRKITPNAFPPLVQRLRK